MSTDVTARKPNPSDNARYEVSVSGGLVNLTIQKRGRELSISTDPQSALLLASDILAAVDNITNADTGDQSQFVFGR